MIATLINQISDISDNQIGSGLDNPLILQGIAIFNSDIFVAQHNGLVSQRIDAVNHHII